MERGLKTLLPLALGVLTAEAALGLVNNFALVLYVKDHLGLSARFAGRAISLFLLVEMLAKAPGGHLSDKLGRKPLLLFAMALAALVPASLPFVAALEPHLIVPLRIIDGLAFGCFWPAAVAAIADAAPPGRRAEAMSIFYLAYVLGIALGPPLGSLSFWTGRLDAPFITASLLLLLSALFFGLSPTGGKGGIVKVGPPLQKEGDRRSAATAPIWAILLVTALQSMGIIALVSILPLLAEHVYGLKRETMGLFFFGPAVLVGLFAPFLGRLADRMGEERAVKVGLLLVTALMWAFTQARHPIHVGVVATALALAYMLAVPAWLSIIASVGGERHKGMALGGMGTVQGLGAMIGPLLGTDLWERGHLLPLYATAITFTLSLLIVTLTVRAPKMV
ncbi:MAG TPA: MFS transporter [Armatimonadetes bacterium]|nr:MFS transporter [Armatimonadota bacterium]